jgi:hypothetical protein
MSQNEGGNVDCIHPAQHEDKWRIFVNKEINIYVSKKAPGNSQVAEATY